MAKRAVLIVLDSVGVGELPDAADYGDTGANTLMNIKTKVPGLELPNMCHIGLSQIEGVENFCTGDNLFTGSCGKLAEVSIGKDTTTGH